MPGFGELFLLGIIILAVLGAKILPRIVDQLGARLNTRKKTISLKTKDEL